MLELKCKCKESSKNFKKLKPGDLEFWVGDCCLENGFDESGKRKAAKRQKPAKPKKEEGKEKEPTKEFDSLFKSGKSSRKSKKEKK